MSVSPYLAGSIYPSNSPGHSCPCHASLPAPGTCQASFPISAFVLMLPLLYIPSLPLLLKLAPSFPTFCLNANFCKDITDCTT